jgi:hypothetical protein
LSPVSARASIFSAMHHKETWAAAAGDRDLSARVDPVSILGERPQNRSRRLPASTL